MLRRISFALVLALLSSGCAMKAYEGPELSRSEIAVLQRNHWHGDTVPHFGVIWAIFPIPVIVPGKKHVTLIMGIDGKEVNRGEIHVLPGKHTVKVSYSRASGGRVCVQAIGCADTEYHTKDISITFTAKAGHEYRIPAERRGEKNWIWVEDAKTGKVVAGEKPPDVKAKGKEPATPPE